MPLVWVLLKICGKSSNKKYMPGEIVINTDQFAFFKVQIATDIKRNANENYISPVTQIIFIQTAHMIKAPWCVKQCSGRCCYQAPRKENTT